MVHHCDVIIAFVKLRGNQYTDDLVQNDKSRMHELGLEIRHTHLLAIFEIVSVDELDSDVNRLTSLHELHSKFIDTIYNPLPSLSK